MKWADLSLQHATRGRRRLCNGELTYGLIVQRQFGNVTTDSTVCHEGDGHRDERRGHGVWVVVAPSTRRQTVFGFRLPLRKYLQNTNVNEQYGRGDTPSRHGGARLR